MTRQELTRRTLALWCPDWPAMAAAAEADLPPLHPVAVLSAVPITATEAAWVRLKGAEAMRQAWVQDGVDPTDPRRRAASPT